MAFNNYESDTKIHTVYHSTKPIISCTFISAKGSQSKTADLVRKSFAIDLQVYMIHYVNFPNRCHNYDYNEGIKKTIPAVLQNYSVLISYRWKHCYVPTWLTASMMCIRGFAKLKKIQKIKKKTCVELTPPTNIFVFGNPLLTWTEHSNHNNQQLTFRNVQTEYTL